MGLDNYLQSLGEQKVLEEKQIEVKKNPKVEELYRIIESKDTDFWSWELGEAWGLLHGLNYRNFHEKIKDLKLTSKDISDFSIRLKDYEQAHGGLNAPCVGVFLSVLINECEENDFTLMLNHLETELYFVGLWNKKNITVYGNVYHAAEEMQKGTLIINGVPKQELGRSLCGGKIIVNGSTEADLGPKMTRGEIHVKGDMKDFDKQKKSFGTLFPNKSSAGDSMSGGKIIIDGNFEGVLINMHEGEVELKGGVEELNAGLCDGGTIYIGGEIGRLGFLSEKTKVYHKGKRVGHTTLSKLYYNKLRKNKHIKRIFG
ncbi:hypothetical protein HY837_06170 [archaeon]|nr:hypothetical protein [archaeon]